MKIERDAIEARNVNFVVKYEMIAQESGEKRRRQMHNENVNGQKG